jgi:hypothetical protein
MLVTAFGAVVVASLLWVTPAFADTFTPESGGSQNANDIDTLYKLTLYIGIVIFLLVWGVLVWSLVKYRARRDGVAHQIRGNTPLEIGWTLGAAATSRTRPPRGRTASARPRRSSRPSTNPTRRRAGGRCCTST